MSRDELWINAELRNVPVPPGLSARLHDIGSLSDGDLDAALRDTHPRAALRNRLLAIGTGNDCDLDDELRSVTIRPELIAALQRLATEPASGLLPLLKARYAGWPSAARQAIGWSTAAVVMFALTAIGWNLRGFWDAPAKPTPEFVVEKTIELNPQDWGNPRDIDALPRFTPPPLPLPAASTISQSSPVIPELPPPVPDNFPQPRRPAKNALVNPRTPDARDVFGINPNQSELPELLSVAEPVARGTRPPNVREYDLIFQLRHGVHPFVSPAAHAELRSVQVPLVSSGSQFAGQGVAQLLAGLRAKRTLPAGRPRVEDLLAAMDYEFTPPTTPTLQLLTAAGNSPFQSRTTTGGALLQVAVQAGEIPLPKAGGRRITLVLDASSHVSRDGRWTALIDGLTRWAEDLYADDRVNLLLAGQQPVSFGTNLDAEQFREQLTKLALIRPSGVCAISAALTKLIDQPAAHGERIIICTPGLLPLTATQFQELRPRLQQHLEKSQARIQVLALRDEATNETGILALTEAGRHPAKVAVNQHQIHWQLREWLTDRPQVIAHDVSLRVNFVPEAVALYRLLGHEATAVSSLIPLEWQTDLRHRETAVGLFQLVLRPTGPDTVAWVELTWLDESGQLHTRRQSVSRRQFAGSSEAVPWSLQLAAAAAETAEILRGSYFSATANQDLNQVRERVDRMPAKLREKPSIRTLRTIWDAAEAIR